MKPFDVITVGAATRDVFLRSRSIRIVRDDQFSTGEAECFALGSKLEVDDIVFETGGGATNTAVGFSRQGFSTAFIGRLGSHDARGREIVAALKEEGVDTSLVAWDKRNMTAYSVILLTDRGERTVLVYRGASAKFQASDVPWSRLRSRWIYVSSLGGSLPVHRSLWRHAARYNIRIVWNPGNGELAHGLDALKPLFRQTSILLLNQEEATSLVGLNRFQDREAFGQIRAYVHGVTVVTAGTDGSFAGDAHTAWHAGTHQITVTDTTGAGDAFGCGFTGAFMRSNGNIGRALQFATANSESVIQAVGAKRGLLSSRAKFAPVRLTPLR